MMSTTSSTAPEMVENSCWTPSMRTEVMAAPGILERRVRRRVLPSVYPNPGSSGSTTNRERLAASGSSSICGRWTISTATPYLE